MPWFMAMGPAAWSIISQEKQLKDEDLKKTYDAGYQHSHLEGLRAVFNAGVLNTDPVEEVEAEASAVKSDENVELPPQP